MRRLPEFLLRRALADRVAHAYSFQTFSVGEVLLASKMNQVEINIRDHLHAAAGVGGLSSTARSLAGKRKTADESVTSSTTLQDDDHLVFPIAASEEWHFDMFLTTGLSLDTCGIKLAITTPSGCVQRMTMVSALSSLKAKTTTTSGVAFDWTAASYPLGTSLDLVQVAVWALNGATPGNVTLQFAQSTSSGTAITLFKGSHATGVQLA